MPYLNAKDVAVIAIISAEWCAMNYTVLPIFFTIFNGIPFMCEMVALTSLILVLCLTKKFGAVTITGLVVAFATLALSPGSTYMLGFAAASVVFDVATRLIGYSSIIGNSKISAIGLGVSSVVAAAVAGVIIGVLFMPLSLMALLGGVGTFAGLHVLGGLVGAILGFAILRALVARKIITATTEQVALGKN